MTSLFNFIFAQAPTPTYTVPPLPPGTGLTAKGIIEKILIPFANFLIGAGIILAIIAIVVSGVMYLKAGGTEANITKAKTWFKNGIIGAFIILAVGVIILTIYNIVVTGNFFSGSPLPTVPAPPAPVSPAPGPITGGPPGTPCTNSNQCVSGTTCDTVSDICIRDIGNLVGEPCKGNRDCNSILRCEFFGISGTCQWP